MIAAQPTGVSPLQPTTTIVGPDTPACLCKFSRQVGDMVHLKFNDEERGIVHNLTSLETGSKRIGTGDARVLITSVLTRAQEAR